MLVHIEKATTARIKDDVHHLYHHVDYQCRVIRHLWVQHSHHWLDSICWQFTHRWQSIFRCFDVLASNWSKFEILVFTD